MLYLPVSTKPAVLLLPTHDAQALQYLPNLPIKAITTITSVDKQIELFYSINQVLNYLYCGI